MAREADVSPGSAATLGGELRLSARIGGPLALGELAWMSTYLVDAAMIGRLAHSALPIAASSLGNTIFYTIAFVAIGMLTGVETLVAQAYGRGNPDAPEECVRTLAQSLWFVILGTPLVMAVTLLFLPLLPHFGVPDDICGETARYLHALIWSAGPLLLYMALRRYLQSTSRVLVVTISLLSAVLINIAGDWAFLYGHLGFRAMGIAGSGWSTVIVRVWMLAVVLLGVGHAFRRSGVEFRGEMLRPDFRRLRVLTRIGWPPAIEYVTDLGFSTWMSIVCARLGTTLLAAHQVVLDLDAFVYMVPLGLSWATVTRVGQSAGQGSFPAVRRSARASLWLAAGYIAVASSLFVGLPRFWGGLYTNDGVVVAAAAPIFLICGFNQLGDAVNVIFCSALTGIGDTRTPFLLNTGIYWLIGAPVSWFLAFHTNLSLRGLWMGRAGAALLTATLMGLVWQAKLRQLEQPARRRSLSLLGALHAP